MSVLDLGMSAALKPMLRKNAEAWPQQRAAAAELCVVVPTFNEQANIEELVERVRNAIAGLTWEIIVVDDNSPDGTAERVRALYHQDPRVRLVRRVGRRGLSSACLEGMLASSADIVAVIDADLGHDLDLLRGMVAILRDDQADLVCASRYLESGAAGGWTQDHGTASKLATWTAKSLTDVELTDPMSGYFAVRREVVERLAPDLSGVGFKILLDMVLAAGPGLRVREVPLTFGYRVADEDKLSPKVVWDFAMMLMQHCSGGALRAELLSYRLIAAAGLLPHMFLLWLFIDLYGVSLAWGQAMAAVGAVLSIYGAKELLSYRRTGPWRWYLGLLPFLVSCAFGIVVGLFTTLWLSKAGLAWWGSGWIGALAASIWNYGALGRHGWSATR
jgi:dolichol-phosphate mannosyltransferase